jgi:ribonuclease D
VSVIDDAAGVAALVGDVRAQGRAALDLEFMWERTYAPIACLAQVAVPGRTWLVDPLAGAPLEPVAGLIADPATTVVVHAPAADLTLLELGFGVRPDNVHDVQLMAGFVGLGAGQSLQALLDRVLGVRLDKGERYTDWTRRPLSERQLEYAAADVAHLLDLADELWRRIDALDRRAWVEEEHERRYSPASRWAPDPEAAWTRVKGQGRMKPAERAVLKALARWREEQAAELDRPASWIVPDRTLIELARRRPRSREAVLRERGMPDRFRAQHADEVVAVIASARDESPIAMPPAPPVDVQARMDVLGPLGQVLVTARAAAAEMAPSLVATRDEIHGYLLGVLTGDDRPSPLATGWRHELAGTALTQLARGEIALAPTADAPYLAERPAQ